MAYSLQETRLGSEVMMVAGGEGLRAVSGSEGTAEPSTGTATSLSGCGMPVPVTRFSLSYRMTKISR